MAALTNLALSIYLLTYLHQEDHCRCWRNLRQVNVMSLWIWVNPLMSIFVIWKLNYRLLLTTVSNMLSYLESDIFFLGWESMSGQVRCVV